MTNEPTIIVSSSEPVTRSVGTAVRRGAGQCCPACGKGKLFHAFLKVHDNCPSCGEALHHQRADDAPAYFTMAIVAHVVVGGLLSIEQNFSPPSWVQLSIWLPTTVLLSLFLLPRIKGALIGQQWALRMHGFGSEAAGDPGLGNFIHPEMKDTGRSR